MKVSRAQAAQNRERIVDVAARLFRERGYDGIGVADLMHGAGLTHGGFYGHFASKQDLLTEACRRGADASVERWRRLRDAAPDQALSQIIASYLSPAHRDGPGQGCTVAALGADVARLSTSARDMMTKGIEDQIAILAGLMRDGTDHERRAQAVAAYATMVGAMVLARAVGAPALSDEILQAAAARLKDDAAR